ncbi:cytochrome P450 [Thelephora ganbajun]|uniref:Cytochrome P450 n=1 Tax=Thelephora ganbajun TaxID=370292 RepID=A0ACB6ZI73_THEGA|nr:cytochrome P450 [Thelephora ganbajun]
MPHHFVERTLQLFWDMDYKQLAAFGGAVAVTYTVYWRYTRISLDDVPGPDNPSFLHGHQPFLQDAEAGELENHYLTTYGSIVRWKGPLGEDRLWIADPKAIFRILHSVDLWVKTAAHREIHAVLLDRGLLWAEGDAHRRQRKALTPAFGLSESRALMPRFFLVANKLVDKWKDVVMSEGSGGPHTLDIQLWMGKATLDAIGIGAFDYEFGALDNLDNPLTKSYTDIVYSTFGAPTNGQLLFMNLCRYLPAGVVRYMFETGSDPALQKARQNRVHAHRVARELIDQKRQEMVVEQTEKDILSLLVKANDTQDEESKLRDDEIIAQVRTLMLAGHETVAKTLMFGLWELAKQPEIQRRLREEITEAYEAARTRGGDDLTPGDIDNLPFTNAVIKETLRRHAAAIEIQRVTWEDNVLPLTRPMVGRSGKTYHSLPVPKGTIVYASCWGYNLNPDVWGPDAMAFRPERWLESSSEKTETPLGMYGNLLTFSAGGRSCIGWRFAVAEIQAFLVTLIREFSFSIPEGRNIRIARPGILVPMVIGEEGKGLQLPLTITPVRDL